MEVAEVAGEHEVAIRPGLVGPPGVVLDAVVEATERGDVTRCDAMGFSPGSSMVDIAVRCGHAAPGVNARGMQGLGAPSLCACGTSTRSPG